MTRVSLRGMRLGVPTLGGGAAWTPANLASLALWLDASDLTTLFQDSAGTVPATADNDVVGYWGDKSGNSRHVTQASTPSKPLLRLVGQNNKPVLRFDGINDYLDGAIWSLSQPLTIFVTAKQAVGSAQNLVRGNVLGDVGLLLTSGGVSAVFAGVSLVGSIPHLYQWHVHSAVVNTSASLLFMDGAPAASGNAGTNSSNTVRIGANPSSAGLLNGDVGELIFVAGALSDADRQSTEAYLMQKWGIS